MSRANEIQATLKSLLLAITTANGFGITINSVREQIDSEEEIASAEAPLVMMARGEEQETEGASGRINAVLPLSMWLVIKNPDHDRAARETAIAAVKKKLREDTRLGSYSGGGFLADNINIGGPEPFWDEESPLELILFEPEVHYHYQASNP